jgi:hypothetical protein
MRLFLVLIALSFGFGTSAGPVKKLLLCGVTGPNLIYVGQGEQDKKVSFYINNRKALNKAFDELLKQFKANGIQIVDPVKADAEAKKAWDTAFDASVDGVNNAMAQNKPSSAESAKVQAQLAKLPPAQRKMIEAQMKAAMAGAPAMAATNSKAVADHNKGMMRNAEARSKVHPDDVVSVKEGEADAKLGKPDQIMVSDQSYNVQTLCKQVPSKNEKDSQTWEVFKKFLTKMGADSYVVVDSDFSIGQRDENHVKMNLTFFDTSGAQILENKNKAYGIEFPDRPKSTQEAAKWLMGGVAKASEKAVTEVLK